MSIEFAQIRDVLLQFYREKVSFEGSLNCAHADERAHNVHTKRFSSARNYAYVNQSKRL